jgi:hypothetical protein
MDLNNYRLVMSKKYPSELYGNFILIAAYLYCLGSILSQ